LWRYGNWKAYSSVYFDHDTENSFNIAYISSITDSLSESNVLNALAKEKSISVFLNYYLWMYTYISSIRIFFPFCRGAGSRSSSLQWSFCLKTKQNNLPLQKNPKQYKPKSTNASTISFCWNPSVSEHWYVVYTQRLELNERYLYSLMRYELVSS